MKMWVHSLGVIGHEILGYNGLYLKGHSTSTVMEAVIIDEPGSVAIPGDLMVSGGNIKNRKPDGMERPVIENDDPDGEVRISFDFRFIDNGSSALKLRTPDGWGNLEIGSLDTTGDVAVHGALSTPDHSLIELRKVTLEQGDYDSYTTSYSADDWTCIIGSFHITDGDFNEGRVEVIIAMYTIIENGNWVIKGETPTYGNNQEETIEVGYVCYRNGIVTMHNWF